MTLERYEGIVEDFDAFTEACERPLPRTGRVNPVESSFSEVRDALTDAGFGLEGLGWFADGFRLEEPEDAKVGNTLPHYLGWIAIQEEVSMIPPVVLDDAVELEDALVLDACAAPGSKTTQVAADAAGVVANDDSFGRIAALRSNTDRLGLTNVAVTSYDGRRFPDGFEFDAALVDVPCTSEGTVRKNPEYGEPGAVSEDERASVVGVQKVYFHAPSTSSLTAGGLCTRRVRLPPRKTKPSSTTSSAEATHASAPSTSVRNRRRVSQSGGAKATSTTCVTQAGTTRT